MLEQSQDHYNARTLSLPHYGMTKAHAQPPVLLSCYYSDAPSEVMQPSTVINRDQTIIKL